MTLCCLIEVLEVYIIVTAENLSCCFCSHSCMFLVPDLGFSGGAGQDWSGLSRFEMMGFEGLDEYQQWKLVESNSGINSPPLMTGPQSHPGLHQ